MKKMITFTVLTLVVVAGLLSFVSVRAASTPAVNTTVSQTQKDTAANKTVTLSNSGCTMNQGTCEGMTNCDMSQCDMKFCDKQNGKCPPGQCKKCMP